MPLYSFEGGSPRIHPSAFVAPTATLIGDVVVEEGASVWYGAVLRGDIAPIRIARNANIQDGSVLHGALSNPTVVGVGVTVAHLCLVHGACLEDGCLVGNGSTILDGARVGAASLVAAHSLVTAGSQIPSGVLVVGSPARVRKTLSGTPAEELVRDNGPAYVALARRHREGIVEVARGWSDPGPW